MKYGFVIQKGSKFYTGKYDFPWADSIDLSYFFSWSDSSTPSITDLVSPDVIDFSGSQVVKVARKIVVIPRGRTSIHNETFRSIQSAFFSAAKSKGLVKIEHHIIFNSLKGKSIYSGIAISSRKDTLNKINNALYRIRGRSDPEFYQSVFGVDFDLYVFNLIKNRMEEELNNRYEEDSVF